MEEPASIVSRAGDGVTVEVVELRFEFEQTDRLSDIEDKFRHLEAMLDRLASACSNHPAEDRLTQFEHAVKERLFDLQNAERTLQRLEGSLGQGDSDPIDLTLQQTLDVVQGLHGLVEIIPNDARLNVAANNVCEGLESFVTSVLSEPGDGPDNEPQVGASPSDLTMALEVIEAIRYCPGGDRTSVYRALRQQFIDGSCRSAWARLDRLLDAGLDRASRKEFLHEALTIWTLMPDLGENAGSPRLSLLPDDARRTVQEAILRNVVGSFEDGDAQALLDAALTTHELVEDYLSMIPSIHLEESQAVFGSLASDSLSRRIRSKISTVSTDKDLELCLSAISTLQAIPGLDCDRQLLSFSPVIRLARWRLRLMGFAHQAGRLLRPASIGVVAAGGILGAYFGLAYLIQRLYEVNMPLAP